LVMTRSVGFLARLRACNRVTVPVEVRWRFGLEPGTLYAVRVSAAGSGGSSTRGSRGAGS